MGFSLLRFAIVPENSCHSLNQSDAKPKPVMTWSTAFSRALDSLIVYISNSHWLLKVFPFLLIGRFNYFGFGFTTLIRKALRACRQFELR